MVRSHAKAALSLLRCVAWDSLNAREEREITAGVIFALCFAARFC